MSPKKKVPKKVATRKPSATKLPVKRKKTPSKTKNKLGSREDLLEQVRSLKRKLWVAERLRFEAVAKVHSPSTNESWDGKLLAAGVAHEFNNILGAADGHAEWGLESGTFEDMSEALKVVRQACRRSLQITKSLQGIPALREESAGVFSLAKVALDLKQHFRPLKKKNGTAFRVELPDVEIYGSESQLFEVLVNLVKNSFEAQSSKIEVSGQVLAKAQVRILVQDNGPGIPESLRERVFHPFFTTKGRLKEMLTTTQGGADPAPSHPMEGGSGLGLFLSQSIVQNMGGRLEHRALAAGTSFQITLPVADLRQKQNSKKS